MGRELLDKAVVLLQQAVEHEERDEKEQALAKYITALQYLTTALKYEKNPTFKKILHAKITGYMERAEELKIELKGKSGKGKSRKGKGEQKDEADDEGEDDPEVAKLKAALSNAIVQEKPNVKWSDVAGLENAKALLLRNITRQHTYAVTIGF